MFGYFYVHPVNIGCEHVCRKQTLQLASVVYWWCTRGSVSFRFVSALSRCLMRRDSITDCKVGAPAGSEGTCRAASSRVAKRDRREFGRDRSTGNGHWMTPFYTRQQCCATHWTQCTGQLYQSLHSVSFVIMVTGQENCFEKPRFFSLKNLKTSKVQLQIVGF